MTTRVAINGLGRIGRAAMRRILEADTGLELAAVNDPSDAATLAHLTRYDSTHGIWPHEVHADGDAIVVDGVRIPKFSTRDVARLPWGDLGVEAVLECTGKYREREAAAQHLEQGAQRVVISAPAKGDDVTICMGVNEGAYDPARHQIISNASCTTNCLAPVAKVLHDSFGIERGFMTTVHAYTQDQRVLDASHKDLRRARSAASNIIPTTTGAARAISLVMPELEGRLDGMAVRVPVPDGSMIDLVVELDREVSASDINDALRAAATDGPLRDYLRYTEVPVVSSDIVGDPASAIVDGLSTMANGRMAKVVAWYDNEWGYACRLVDATAYVAAKVAA